MHATQVDDPAAFFATTASLRAVHPLLTTVFTSVGANLEAGHAYKGSQWWLVRAAGQVVGAAMWTPPFPLACTPMPADAARALGAAIARATPPPPVVAGPDDVVAAVVRAEDPTHDLVPQMAETLYVLGALLRPLGVPGRARAADAGELDDLVRWHAEFNREAGLPVIERPEDLLLRKVSDQALWWWEQDGTRVSLAGHAPVVGDRAHAVGRIGPVYTPIPFRRNGFGAAVTAHVAAVLQERCDTVALFADDANPTSNGVYRRLGFEAAATWVEVPVRRRGRTGRPGPA